MALERKLFLIRGISGSGKSFLANELRQKLYPEAVFDIEADLWFQKDGVYTFNGNELGSAHSWCQLSVEYVLRTTINCNIIVSNTFTTKKEILPYAKISLKYCCPIEILEPNTSWKNDPDECAKRNRHGVPLEIIKKQLARFYPMENCVYGTKDLIRILEN